MKKTFIHRLVPMTRSKRGGIVPHAEILEEMPMFQAQSLAAGIARTRQCDVEHSAYNDYLRKWDVLGTYHADGTCTDAFGDTRRFTGDPVRPLASLEKK